MWQSVLILCQAITNKSMYVKHFNSGRLVNFLPWSFTLFFFNHCLVERRDPLSLQIQSTDRGLKIFLKNLLSTFRLHRYNKVLSESSRVLLTTLQHKSILEGSLAPHKLFWVLLGSHRQLHTLFLRSCLGVTMVLKFVHNLSVYRL